MNKNYEELHSWCSLWRVPRVGCKTFYNIIEVFGSPKTFFSASLSQIQKIGLKIDKATLLQAQQNAEQDIAWFESNDDNHIITYDSADYPEQLKQISDPPPILFVKGDVSLLSLPQLAIVGSRSPSHDGMANARNFADYLSKNGLVVTSGLALGIDGEAHRGALISGQTIAVMGTGSDRIYPAKHHDLAHEIATNGALVTELPIGTPVRTDSFPRRNRIISGLSLGTLVIEASIQSGSLITAKLALEQGREVFAIPGSIHNPQAKGCNSLIKQGAKLVETGGDIFEEMHAALQLYISEPNNYSQTITANQVEHKLANSKRTSSRSLFGDSGSKPNSNPSPNPNSAKYLETKNNISAPKIQEKVFEDSNKQLIWDAIDYDVTPIDEIVKRSGLEVKMVSSMLLILELEGLVVKSAGAMYQKSRES